MSSLTPTNTSPKSSDALSLDVSQPVKIEKLVYEGWGLSRHPDGPVVFIPFSAPGDTVTLKTPFKTAKRVAFCEAQTFEATSDTRVQAQCEQFTHCGGCHWQHLSYDTQIDWKQRILEETFQRLAKVSAPPLKAFLASPSPYFYRNHITWHRQNGILGFHHWHDNTLVSSQACQIVPDWVNRLHQILSTGLTEIPSATTPSEKLNLDLRWNDAEQFVVLVSSAAAPEGLKSALKQFAKHIAEHVAPEKFIGLVWDSGEALHTLYGQPSLDILVNTIPFRVSTGAFFQGNSPILHQFTQAVIGAAQDGLSADNPSMLDVYAGGGLFSRLLAETNSSVRILAIESHPIACEDFEVNLEAVENDVTLASDEAEVVLPALDDTFDVAIIDPPRAGCKPKVLEALSTCVQNRIVYVSCDPTTLARDTRILQDTGYWELVSLQGVDLFPQTYHIEAIAVFERKASS
jgi:23S rRNA (uracil1939-C5)-methyltransferase